MAKLDSPGPWCSRGGHGGIGGSPTNPVSLRGSGGNNLVAPKSQIVEVFHFSDFVTCLSIHLIEARYI